jgi:pyruvyltransferase
MVKAYWWRALRNFGDGLNPFLLRHFAGVDVEWGDMADASVVSLGSVLEHVPPNWNGNIVGVGRLYGPSAPMYNRATVNIASARIWALRGPLSAKGIKGDFALGDPGLLADELVADDIVTREYDLGVLPHWSDRQLTQRPEWYNSKWSTRVIMSDENPLQVVREISRCKKLVTSSLHGLIVADAVGIPRRLEYTKTLDNEGGKFKFQDYSASVCAPLELGKLITAPRFHVEDRKHEIFDALAAYGRFACSSS